MWLYLIISARTKRYVEFVLSYRRGKRGGRKAEGSRIGLRSSKTQHTFSSSVKEDSMAGLESLDCLASSGRKGEASRKKWCLAKDSHLSRENTTDQSSKGELSCS